MIDRFYSNKIFSNGDSEQSKNNRLSSSQTGDFIWSAIFAVANPVGPDSLRIIRKSSPPKNPLQNINSLIGKSGIQQIFHKFRRVSGINSGSAPINIRGVVSFIGFRQTVDAKF